MPGGIIEVKSPSDDMFKGLCYFLKYAKLLPSFPAFS